jgi:protein-tyrosine phosphatase
MQSPCFIDIHCHLLPGLDDGARSWDEAVEMARIAQAEGTSVIFATPHQLGPYRHIEGEQIRQRTTQLQQLLCQRGISIQVFPGAEVRPDELLLREMLRGNVVTLADQRCHILLELPRATATPDCFVETLLQLQRGGTVGVLASPERHPELQKRPEQIRSLVTQGCLMQVTAGSLLGDFGPTARRTCEWMLCQHLAHFLATDSRGSRARRPLLRRAFQRTRELIGDELARRICFQNPTSVLEGGRIEAFPPPRHSARRLRWLARIRAA